jgi:hypothetical protein
MCAIVHAVTIRGTVDTKSLAEQRTISLKRMHTRHSIQAFEIAYTQGFPVAARADLWKSLEISCPFVFFFCFWRGFTIGQAAQRAPLFFFIARL